MKLAGIRLEQLTILILEKQWREREKARLWVSGLEPMGNNGTMESNNNGGNFHFPSIVRNKQASAANYEAIRVWKVLHRRLDENSSCSRNGARARGCMVETNELLEMHLEWACSPLPVFHLHHIAKAFLLGLISFRCLMSAEGREKMQARERQYKCRLRFANSFCLRRGEFKPPLLPPPPLSPSPPPAQWTMQLNIFIFHRRKKYTWKFFFITQRKFVSFN